MHNKHLQTINSSGTRHDFNEFYIVQGSEEESEVEVKDNVTNNETISTTVNDEKEKIEGMSAQVLYCLITMILITSGCSFTVDDISAYPYYYYSL